MAHKDGSKSGGRKKGTQNKDKVFLQKILDSYVDTNGKSGYHPEERLMKACDDIRTMAENTSDITEYSKLMAIVVKIEKSFMNKRIADRTANDVTISDERTYEDQLDELE